MTTNLPLVFAMTGASGAGIAIRLLECVLHAKIPVQMSVSEAACEVLRTELGLDPNVRSGQFSAEEFGLSASKPWWKNLADHAPPPFASRVESAGVIEATVTEATVELYDSRDLLSPIASGSHLTRGMVICPCSASTLSTICHSVGTNLIHRAADVHLKERRRLVLVPRETPLSTPMLENMAAISRYGATVLPASPGWYHGVRDVYDLIDFVVARILDQFQIPHQLMKRWGAK
jgi:4-hydroxy-3-polyprenylbenzoate decarboxylase